MTRQHIHIHRPHPRQPNKSRSQRFTAVNCTLCTASFPPLPPKQHNFFYVVTLLLLIVIFDCCFLWRNLFNPFALRLLFSPLRYSPANACAAAFLADTPLCTISSLRPNPLLPRAYLAAHLPRFNILPPLFLLAVQGSAFPGAFVSCGTMALPSAKTSMFIGLFGSLCIFIHRLFRSLLTVYHRSLPCRFVRFCSPQTLPPASTNGFSLCDGRFAFSRATVVPVHRFCRRRALFSLCAQLVNRFAFCFDCRRLLSSPYFCRAAPRSPLFV